MKISRLRNVLLFKHVGRIPLCLLHMRREPQTQNYSEVYFYLVAGSIPDGVIKIFHSYNPSDRTVALGLTHPLTEISFLFCGAATQRGSWPPHS